MTSLSQVIYLVKQELRSASRTRYVILSFVLAPILMWGLQGGIQALMMVAIEGEVTGVQGNLYITNLDPDNLVPLSQNYTLPLDFGGHTAGTNVTEIELSDFLVTLIEQTAQNNNNSALYNMEIISNHSFSEVESLAQEGKVDYWLIIPEGFGEQYNATDVATVELRYLQSGLVGPVAMEASIYTFLGNKPFTIVDVTKQTSIQKKQITFGDEDESDFGDSFGAGFAGFIAIMIAVFAPAPFVATSFAGEREKKTMEALLALPMSRRMILVGKLGAGMVLIALFALMNIVGMFLYNTITTAAAPTGENAEGAFLLSIDLAFMSVLSITIALMLSAFIAIGVGIAIASLTKDVRTSESAYQMVLMIPSLLVGMIGMFSGVPESMGGAALLLYLIPWSHSLAIFQKMLRPEYFDVKSLLGMGLIPDLLFHLTFLLVSIAIILAIASKIFEREGIVN